MIELALLAAAAIVGVGLAHERYGRRSREWLRAQERSWHGAAHACGLAPVTQRSHLVSDNVVVLHQGARTITITPLGGTDIAAARVTIDGLPRSVRVRHDALRVQVARFVDTDALRLGDPQFDDACVVEGPALIVRAVFDAPTRQAALELFRPGKGTSESIGVENGVLHLRYADDVLPRPPDPPEYLRQALAFADRLEGGEEEARLAAIVRADPIAAVRRLALEALRDERASAPATRAVLADACADPDPQVRLTAALGLGPVDGRATLVALASDALLADELCDRALAPLGPDLTADEARAILSASLRGRRPAAAALCIDSLDRAGACDPDALAHLLPRSDGPLALAAVRALGRCGTAMHVPVLRDAEKEAFGFGPLADACRAAIAAIQARAQDATPGQLSLASSGGTVSLADDPRGRLELPQGPVGGTDDPGRPG